MRRQGVMVIRLVFALLMGLLPLAGMLPAAAQDRGLVDDSSYESPQFGYTVTWGEDWRARERDVISNPGGFDTLTLRGSEGILLLQGQGAGTTPAEAVEARIRIEGGEDDVSAMDLEAAVPFVEMTPGRDQVRIEGYTLDDGVVLIAVLSARAADYDLALQQVHEQVAVNDSPVLTGQPLGAVAPQQPRDFSTETETATTAVTEVETDTETASATETETESETETVTDTESDTATEVETGSGESAIVDGSYLSPMYGYSFTFDPELWEVTEEFLDDAGDGVHLATDTGTLMVFSWSAYGADPVACLDGEASYYANDDPTVEAWEPALDADGEPIRYETDEYAYGVYRLTYVRDGEPIDVVDYIECRAIPGEEAVVIIYASATPEQYNDHLDESLNVMETIAFLEVEGPVDITTETETATTATTEIPETGLVGSLYTSPSFGFTIEIPVQWQVTGEELAAADERLLLTNGISDITVWATDAYGGDLAGCVDFAAAEAPYELELAETATGDPFRGDDRNGAFGNFLYDDGDEAFFISCQYIEDGESVLILMQDVPADEQAEQRKFRIDLQQAIEMP